MQIPGNVYYTQKNVWATIGIIFAVILPLLLILTCIIYCWRKKHLEKDPTWRMPIPSRSASRSTLRNLGSERDDNTIEKVRNYDGTYKTHEPLAGKPDIDFSKKKFDLDDEEVTSNEGMGPMDASRDFDYQDGPTPSGTQQRQLGRRAQRQNAIQEEDDELNFAPQTQPTNTFGSTYTPNYRNNDMNSFIASPEQSPPALRNLNITNPAGQFYRPAPAPVVTPTQSVGLPSPSSPTNEGRSTQV